MKRILFSILFMHVLLSCSKDDPTLIAESERDFKMGFTTWPYGPELEDVNDTYSFIANNGDIYAEHIDNKIPWNAWIDDLPLPTEFTKEITGRAKRIIPGKKLLLSVSLLNSNRDDLASDFDGVAPFYENLDDTAIRNAYFKHISYLITNFQPDYLVIAIEVNELRLRSPEKWNSYKRLMVDVKSRIKQSYPDLRISESISLHNLYQPDIADPESYIEDIFNHVNQNDFVAVSFYPFLKNLGSKNDFQEAFNFLHATVTSPIAFVETAHIAENLVIPNLNVSMDGSENEQSDYLDILIENAHHQDYEFIIWWAHRDYDALWETFPKGIKDLARIWRDTGLLSENGTKRPAFTVWSSTFQN